MRMATYLRDPTRQVATLLKGDHSHPHRDRRSWGQNCNLADPFTGPIGQTVPWEIGIPSARGRLVRL